MGSSTAVNPVERMLRKVDGTQQKFQPSAFVFGVVKKYGDDNGGVLVTNLAHTAFVTFFPLLLVLITVLGLVAAGDPVFRQDPVNAVLARLPVRPARQLTVTQVTEVTPDSKFPSSLETVEPLSMEWE